MAYVECKIWPFSDEISHQEARWGAMKEGHVYYTVKVLFDTSTTTNFIRKSLADKLGINYTKSSKYKNIHYVPGFVEILYISFHIREKISWHPVVIMFLMVSR